MSSGVRVQEARTPGDATPKIEDDSVIGIGTGSTANYFIDYLADIKGQINATVASSEASAERLKKHGIPVFDLNAVDQILLKDWAWAYPEYTFSVAMDPSKIDTITVDINKATADVNKENNQLKVL